MGEMVEWGWWDSAYGKANGTALYEKFRSQYGHQVENLDTLIKCRECSATFPAGVLLTELNAHSSTHTK